MKGKPLTIAAYSVYRDRGRVMGKDTSNKGADWWKRSYWPTSAILRRLMK
ncbi:hypothetical protein [Paenibacillus lentus]|nr:hypothetical protein [Paenibacillus lentus]